MKQRKRLTSKELAKLVGVSSATVSRAFSDSTKIKKATRDQVLAVAKEHNYQPSAIARSMLDKKTKLVAIVVNTLANPCEAEQLNILVHRLQERQLMPIILCCGVLEDRLALMRLASSYDVDFVIVFSDLLSISDVQEIFVSARPIMMTLEPNYHPDVATLEISGEAAAGEIVDQIVKKGHSRFAYLEGRESSWVDQKRQSWFQNALDAHDLTFEAFAHGDYSYDSGFKEAIMLLRRNTIDALICGNDVMAIGASDAARSVLGKSIPDDLSVVGQDGIIMAGWESHNLTTLALDHVKYIDAIITMIETEDKNPVENFAIQIPCFVQWGSTT